LQGVLWNADIIVNCLMGVDKAVAQATLRYCKQLVPGLLPQVWAIVMSKHLQVSQGMPTGGHNVSTCCPCDPYTTLLYQLHMQQACLVC
jgi:hypothetical protein